MKTGHGIRFKDFLVLIISLCFSASAGAEGFGLESVTESLSETQDSAQAVKQSLEAGQQMQDSTLTSGAAAAGGSSSLTDTLVNKLGISTQQAQGGAGALFKSAQGQLDAEQFASLSKAVPEMDTLLGAAPKQSDTLTGMASMLGDKGQSYGNLAGLASSFNQLGLSPDMVDQFVPVVVDYVRTQGGDLTANMLQSALLGN